MVPSAHVHKISALIEEVERSVVQVQIDLELNSLEDAFIKIAEADIKKEEEKVKELHMSPEDEEKAMRDYFEFEGRQNCCQKILVVTKHRLLLFYRSTT